MPKLPRGNSTGAGLAGKSGTNLLQEPRVRARLEALLASVKVPGAWPC